MITLPATVRSFRGIGLNSRDAWQDKVPPADFGGFGFLQRDNASHGMAATASPFTFIATDLAKLGTDYEQRFEATRVVEDLASFLPVSRAAGMPEFRCAHDRGVWEVRHLLDLLWSFHGVTTVKDVENPAVSLNAAHKHFILTSSTEIPEDVVKAAIVAALSPLQEKVTLHAVGLGAQGLLRDPTRAFCRLVHSGDNGLAWQVKEHTNWTALFEWLHDGAIDELEPLQLFSTRRQLEVEIRRSCAEAGGVAWSRLFVPEPFEQLRRWTHVIEGEVAK
eukprot:TRINITY_DN11925_c0_g1_i2.p1 TRINITY_DN11925_c0_g1~~TRINITY_DN11925_c0_g1_i2.p1  ORF type:complete len:277 (+),score=40.76 TRINITY_DN11925_c0_g1_i2:343-1173(+)